MPRKQKLEHEIDPNEIEEFVKREEARQEDIILDILLKKFSGQDDEDYLEEVAHTIMMELR